MPHMLAYIAGVANLAVSQTRIYLQMVAMIAAVISIAKAMAAFVKFVEMVNNQIQLKLAVYRAQKDTQARKVDVLFVLQAGHQMFSKSSVMSVRPLR